MMQYYRVFCIILIKTKHQKNLKKAYLLIVTIVLSLFAFISCDKDDLEISKENVLGQWEKDYSDYPYYAP